MFEQNPVIGPGTGTTTTHTLEILVMLAGAFLLGLWMGWLLWNRFKAAYDALLAEHETAKASLGLKELEVDTLNKKIAQLDGDNLTMRTRIDSLTADHHDTEARAQHLSGQVAHWRERAAALETELAALRPAEVPMEVIESPVDVHIESLVEDLPAVEEAVVEAPVVEPVIENLAIELDEVEVEVPAVVAEVPPVEIEAPAAEPTVEVEERVVVNTYTGKPVTIERVIVHQPYVDETARPEAEPAAEPKEDSPAYAPVFSFTPAASADDLRIIEGIGPKIEQVLNAEGISTFRQLSETSEERLREILAAAGNRYKMHDPSTWSEQARLADSGDWEALKNWQDQLKAGREVGGYEAAAEAEILEEKPVVEQIEKPTNGVYVTPDIIPDEALLISDEPAAVAADDLKVVEGIGPKIQELLNSNGINTFAELSTTSVARLKEILDTAGGRFAIHDPGTWPAQALLAANGEWENLKAYQGFLNAGKRPE